MLIARLQNIFFIRGPAATDFPAIFVRQFSELALIEPILELEEKIISPL